MSEHETCFCGSKLYLTSIIPENWQANVKCLDESCGLYGFISKGKLFLEDKKTGSYLMRLK